MVNSHNYHLSGNPQMQFFNEQQETTKWLLCCCENTEKATFGFVVIKIRNLFMMFLNRLSAKYVNVTSICFEFHLTLDGHKNKSKLKIPPQFKAQSFYANFIINVQCIRYIFKH